MNLYKQFLNWNKKMRKIITRFRPNPIYISIYIFCKKQINKSNILKSHQDPEEKLLTPPNTEHVFYWGSDMDPVFYWWSEVFSRLNPDPVNFNPDPVNFNPDPLPFFNVAKKMLCGSRNIYGIKIYFNNSDASIFRWLRSNDWT